jgi:Ca2+-binding EF-hand superfamily protein
MNRGLFSTAMASLFLLTSVGAAAQSAGDKLQEENKKSFVGWDDDRDGRLSLQEYMDYATIEAGMNQAEAQGAFENMDADSSGNLSFEEFDGGICCV